LLEDLGLKKKDSKYGLLVRDDKKIDTIITIEAVTEKGMDMSRQTVVMENNPMTFEVASPTLFKEDTL
jgi:hypothetical protein